ncbi:GNAT family N-acetyltransferase [Aureimonas sp. ME7]|uniref:GNAT family N-acetyltransferase n=1 Tax=Aureimonas sp. ME7 TaxID=2744252 RepID=UPI0015F56D8E|nr:GNAT family N-acetyltransferase [Aureimonas sp. ME7]
MTLLRSLKADSPARSAAWPLGLSEGVPRPGDFAVFDTPPDTRRVDIYEAHAVFDLVEELEFLGARAIEANVFFTPRFLAPAMPRLDERRVRLMVARDENSQRSRLRFLMPFSVERLGAPSRMTAVRAWTHPFGPLGSLPLDGDAPDRTAAGLLDALREPGHALPRLLVLPDLPVSGRLADVLLRAAEGAGLAHAWTDRRARAFLDAETGDPGDVLRRHLGAKGRRDHARRLRRLQAMGAVRFEVAADPEPVRAALEDFLHLEASGWKGRRRSALLIDRHRAAFAREAVNGLSEAGMVRIYTLRLDTRAVASLVVLHSGGHAVAWKTAFDEAYRSCRPGALVAALATEALLADPVIRSVDSCTVPDHGVMNLLWPGRREVGTLVIGLEPGMDGAVADGARAIEDGRHRANRRRIWRERLARLWPRRS